MSKEDSEMLVSVYVTSNSAIIPLVKSILDEAGIQYLAHGENMQNMEPINVFPVDFQVMPDNEEYARELLKDINPNGSDDTAETEDSDEDNESE